MLKYIINIVSIVLLVVSFLPDSRLGDKTARMNNAASPEKVSVTINIEGMNKEDLKELVTFLQNRRKITKKDTSNPACYDTVKNMNNLAVIINR